MRILAQSRFGSQVCQLPTVVSILCEGNYEPELRRDHIYQVVVDTIKATLDKMAELSLPIKNPETATRSHVIQCLQLPTDNFEATEELGKALVSLWDDSGVRTCYQDSVEGTAHPSAT